MNSEQIKDMHLLYNAVYNEELREKFEEYNNAIHDEDIVEVATEYFYSYGLNEDGIDILIEELGIGEFVEFVYDIVEDYYLTEARSGGTKIEPKLASGKEIKGKPKAASLKRLRAQKAARQEAENKASESKPSGMTAALRSQATKAAAKKQPEKESTPAKTKQGIGSKIGSALKRAGEDIAITYKVAREVGKRAEKSAPVRKFWGFKDKEEVKEWVNQLVEEGYDLSDYTWDEMAEIYESSGMSADDRRTWNRLVKTHGPEPFTNPTKRSKSDTRSASRVPPTEKPKRRTKLGDVDIKEDIYDVILSHLLDEGYAESVEQAEVIMVNMSEDWRESIVEAAADQSDKQIEKGVKTTYKAKGVLANQASRGLNRLPSNEREGKKERMNKRLETRRDDLFGERNKREDESRSEIKKKYGI
jgi:hypothetical protein